MLHLTRNVAKPLTFTAFLQRQDFLDLVLFKACQKLFFSEKDKKILHFRVKRRLIRGKTGPYNTLTVSKISYLMLMDVYIQL